MIRAVLFDLDGTLYDRDALVCRLLEAQHAAFANQLPAISKERFIADVLAMDDHGYGEKTEGYRRLAEEWGLAPDLTDRLVEHFWSNYDNLCVASEDTAMTLATLRAHGKRIGVITNGSVARQRSKLAALNLLDVCDPILISESEGVRKPSPEIFARAVAGCGVSCREAVFVGDHPQVDVEGAKNAGLLAIWKYVPYWTLDCADVMTVHRLSEILPICLRE